MHGIHQEKSLTGFENPPGWQTLKNKQLNVTCHQ
jgi:hypothetical protein